MKRQLAATLGAVVLCAAAGAALAGYESDPGQAAQAAGRAEGVPKQAASAALPESTALPAERVVYRLGESEGRLAVFVEESDRPEMVLDVYLSSLPRADQLALAQGITVVGYSRLVLALEDYIS